MELNDLLAKQQIDLRTVLVLRHRPVEPELRKVLPWLAAERPETFNAYQRTQGPPAEKAMQKAEVVASFIGHQSGKALFIGLYRRKDWRPLTFDEFWCVPAFVEMRAFGMRGFDKERELERGRESVLWFDLDPLDLYAEWKGRLIVDWPPLERSWWRWAGRNRIPVHAIREESILDSAMPLWDDLVLTWEELQVLPRKWKAALARWRGIYFIFDETDGKGYVGSACGSDNILGRWLDYARSGHGWNEELRRRAPARLRFSILQRLSPDLEPGEVVQIESTWKSWLHTRDHGMNRN